MSRSLIRIPRLLFSLAIAGGLAFGARSALASPARSACPYNPSQGYFALSCTAGAAGNAYCDQQCKSIVGQWSQGFCHRAEGCCVCAV